MHAKFSNEHRHHPCSSQCSWKKTRGLAVLIGVSWEPRPRSICGWVASLFCVKTRRVGKGDLYGFIHYTDPTTSPALNECLLAHNFQNNCSTECHLITRNEVWMHNKCHKIYLSGPFGIFCPYVILTISYLETETSSLPTDSSRPLFKQIEIFSGILAVYFNCKYFS